MKRLWMFLAGAPVLLGLVGFCFGWRSSPVVMIAAAALAAGCVLVSLAHYIYRRFTMPNDFDQLRPVLQKVHAFYATAIPLTLTSVFLTVLAAALSFGNEEFPHLVEGDGLLVYLDSTQGKWVVAPERHKFRTSPWAPRAVFLRGQNWTTSDCFEISRNMRAWVTVSFTAMELTKPELVTAALEAGTLSPYNPAQSVSPRMITAEKLSKLAGSVTLLEGLPALEKVVLESLTAEYPEVTAVKISF